MRATEKLNLIKNICSALTQNVGDYGDQIYVLEHNGIKILKDENGFADVKESLKYTTEEKLKKVSDEVELSPNLASRVKSYPKCWSQSENLKLFISHSSKQKNSANKLKDALKIHKIDCFVAHEDVKPTLEWQTEIEKALNTMDCFVSIHTEDFNKSPWCQQEIGFAISRNVEIIPIKTRMISDPSKEVLPEGFSSKIQAIRAEKLEDLVTKICSLIEDSEKIGELYKNLNPKEEDEEIPF